jgi:hypothetical protein
MSVMHTSKWGTGKGPDPIPVPFILSRKNLRPYHIVVGTDEVQIRFLAQTLNTEVQRVDRATDDLLVGRENVLLHVYAAYRIDLSPEIRSKTAIWAANPIVKGSAAMNAIVRFAATLFPDRKVTRDEIEIVGGLLSKYQFNDLRPMLWKAVWILSGQIVPPKLWLDPWESPTKWLDPTMNVKERLYTLYLKLRAHTYIHCFEPEAAEGCGVKPSEQQRLKSLILDPAKVYKTILLLSQWKEGVWNDWICALQISCVWE